MRLEYYRLQKISEGSINLREGDARPLDGPTEVGSGIVRPQPVPLSQLIELVNERFGTDFNQADQLFFDQIVEAAMADDGLRQAAVVNPGDKFELVFKTLLENLFVERMDQNEEIFVRFMNDIPFQKVVTTWMASEAYKRLRSDAGRESPSRRTWNRRRRNSAEAPNRATAPEGPLRDLCAARSSQGRSRRIQRFAACRRRRSDVGSRRDETPSAPRHVRGSGRRQVDGTGHSGRCILLFAAPVTGTREGKTVLVQLRDAIDPESGQRYTVKRYESEKARDGNSWRHVVITLKPVNPNFQPIVLTGDDDGQLRVIAELVEVLEDKMEIEE